MQYRTFEGKLEEEKIQNLNKTIINIKYAQDLQNFN